MSTWVISSELRALRRFTGALLVALSPTELGAQLSLDEALRVAFPAPAVIERRTAFLTREDLQVIQRQAGRDAPVTQSVVTYYVARHDGTPAGVAYFDSHRVRTLNEVVMIVVDPSDRIRTIEVLRFAEPPEYYPSRAWLQQLRGRPLNAQLSLRGSIATMTGATLTSSAIVRAARRILALHARIRPFQTASRP
jgi:uncharacterized protein with FMN-binding domain